MRICRFACAVAIAACCFGTAARASRSETHCSGSWIGSGEATFYAASDANACSLPLAPDEYVAAVPAADFDGSAVCGRCMRITGPQGTIVARITDYCVGAGCRAFDLSPNAFAAIGNPVDGIIPVGWVSVACDVEGPISFYVNPGSNAYYAKIQVRNHRYGIAGLSMKTADGGSYVPLDRSIDDAFESLSATPILAPLSFQVSDLHGDVLDETIPAYTPGSESAGVGQFAVCPEPTTELGGAAAWIAAAALRRRRARA